MCGQQNLIWSPWSDKNVGGPHININNICIVGFGSVKSGIYRLYGT